MSSLPTQEAQRWGNRRTRSSHRPPRNDAVWLYCSTEPAISAVNRCASSFFFSDDSFAFSYLL